MRTSLPLAAVLVASACQPAPPAQVVVRHRCGALNVDALEGTYGKLQGENGVNGKFRVKFATADGRIEARWVPGGHERLLLVGRATGSETAELAEEGEGRRARVSLKLTDDCRLEATFATREADGAVVPSAEPPNRYVPFPDLASRDFEPCTEVLHMGSAARSYAAARGAKPPEQPPTVRNSSMPVAAWSDPGEIPSGCSAQFDLWTDGQAMDAVASKEVEEVDGRLRWHHDYENDFLGVHDVALHRKAVCPGQPPRLLGVACLVVEVK